MPAHRPGGRAVVPDLGGLERLACEITDALGGGIRVLTGVKTATTEELPDAVAVMDPFYVVQLAGTALDDCRRRTQQQTLRHRGHAGDPLYGARRTLHTGTDLLTTRQH